MEELRFSAKGDISRPLQPMHTTQDGVVEKRRNEHFEEMGSSWNPMEREAWKEDASTWGRPYRRMLIEKYGVRGYKVRVGRAKLEEETEEAVQEEELAKEEEEHTNKNQAAA